MRSGHQSSSSSQCCSTDTAVNDAVLSNRPLHEQLSSMDLAYSLTRHTPSDAALVSATDAASMDNKRMACPDKSWHANNVQHSPKSSDGGNNRSRDCDLANPAAIQPDDCPSSASRRKQHATRRPGLPPHEHSSLARQPLHQRRLHRKQRLSALSISCIFAMAAAATLLQASVTHHLLVAAYSTAGGGYLTPPPSSNYLAYTHNSQRPSASNPLSSLPEKEPTPHNLNAGMLPRMSYLPPPLPRMRYLPPPPLLPPRESLPPPPRIKLPPMPPR